MALKIGDVAPHKVLDLIGDGADLFRLVSAGEAFKMI